MSTEGGVDTAAFLEACEGLVKLFDLLGNTAFKVVQNDMNGNIAVSIPSEVPEQQDAASQVQQLNGILLFAS